MAMLPMAGLKASDVNKQRHQHSSRMRAKSAIPDLLPDDPNTDTEEEHSMTQESHSKEQADDPTHFKRLRPSMKHVERAIERPRSNSLTNSSDIHAARPLSDAIQHSRSSDDVRNIQGSQAVGDAADTHPMSTKSVLSSSHPSIHAIADVLIHMPGPNHPKFKLQRQISDPMLGCLGHRYLPVSPLAATDITLDQKFSAVSLEKDIPVLSAPGSQILSRFAAKQLLSKRAMKRDHRTTKDNLEQMQTFSGSHPELYFTSHDLANFE